MAADDYDAFLDQLQSSDESGRKVALQSLALKGEAGAGYAVEAGRLLQDEYEEVRRAAAIALGKIGEKAGHQANALVTALSDEGKTVRAEAARALGALGSASSGKFVAQVAGLAGDEDELAQSAAVESLTALGEASCLAPFMRSKFPSVLRATLVALARSPAARCEHVGLIIPLLTHSESPVRLAAVQASGEVGSSCGTDHLRALGALRKKEPIAKVRRAAVQALGRCGEAAVLELGEFLQDDDEAVRFFAAETLASLGGPAAASCAAGLLADASCMSPTRCAALKALGKLHIDGLEYSSCVAEHLQHCDLACRLAAIQALSDMGASREAAALGALSTDENKGIRQAAVSALAKLGADGAEAAVAFLEDEDQAVRQAAVKVYSPLHSKLPAEVAFLYVDQVACKLLDEDWRVRFAAVVALGDLHAIDYVEQVAALAVDADGQVRRSAVAALEKFGGPAVFVAAFLGDEDRRVREDAERVYASLGGGRGGDDDGELSEVE